MCPENILKMIAWKIIIFRAIIFVQLWWPWRAVLFEDRTQRKTVLLSRLLAEQQCEGCQAGLALYKQIAVVMFLNSCIT